jgi:hypothetical protein
MHLLAGATKRAHHGQEDTHVIAHDEHAFSRLFMHEKRTALSLIKHYQRLRRHVPGGAFTHTRRECSAVRDKKDRTAAHVG